MTTVNHFLNSLDKYDTLCLSGGGIKCFAFIGALNYIEETHNFNIKQIKKYVGTSGGAILCYLLSIGYSVLEIKEFIINFNFAKINTEISIINLLEEFGLVDGDKLMFLLIHFLKEKYNIDDITFMDLYNLTNNELYIIGTNYTRGIEKCFSYKHTPDVSVFTALRITISIPVIFKPVFFENEYYIDGAFINNFPIDYCNESTTLGMYVKYITNNYNQLNNVFNLILGTFSIVNDVISEKNNFNKNNIITIVDNYNKVVNQAEFNLSIEDKNNLINLGWNCIKLHIENS